jgi:hypothetical protein
MTREEIRVDLDGCEAFDRASDGAREALVDAVVAILDGFGIVVEDE